ncbi:excinuclease ABC subunit UvrA [Hydrogenophilus thermoluteolus]|uniref:UvrABC system protein A n=1 Tax=Hydrogenophilus thermoluteolus TaxID=297 RepID=A0A2Z6DWV7_HYDTE|nr:excinuclease ABC subunit UvrA [Hydrogenophilus thermoluteolus]BBD76875.1 excinuclease ABC subunit A [Hydrogenophilus thermoluteolus]
MITIRGARTHNLKNISLTIPDNQITVITGVSGSGKSSLAFDTLFAEGQRRYLDALSLSARQWLDQLPRPDVDWISGLRPAIALTQQTLNASPRSTVGTMSEVLDALRLLFARLGTPHCPHHPDEPLARHSLAEIRDTVLNRWEGARIALLVPKRALPNHLTTFEALRAAGYARLWHDQQTVELESCFGPIPENAAVVIDRLKVRPEQSARLTDSLEHALTLGSGTALVCDLDQSATLRFDTHPTCPRCGFTAAELEPHHLSFNHPAGACPTCHGLGMIERAQPPQTAPADPPPADHTHLCPDCLGTRLNPAARAVRFEGATLPELEALPLEALHSAVREWSAHYHTHPVAQPILQLIEVRLRQMVALGLGYLTLARRTPTLSGGERQRVRLATQLSNALSGVLFVLDEPTSGLHPRDIRKVLTALEQLRDAGNTVVVVEHDATTMHAADHLIEIGPGAGAHGGEVVYQGDYRGLTAANTPTGHFLRKPIDLSAHRKPIAPEHPAVWHLGVRVHNLKGDPIAYPVGALIAVCGVSGAGKSSLLFDALEPYVRAVLDNHPRDPVWGRLMLGTCAAPPSSDATSDGPLPWQRIITVDQQPIGHNARSTPATFTGIMTALRECFAQTPEARARGYTASRFSYNVRGGRCEVCQGEGWRKIEMQFLPPVIEPCPACHGARYNRETLEIRYRGVTISEALTLSAQDALKLFDNHPQIRRVLTTLVQLGLGYLPLGQPAPTLSGGEAQRLKLARELAKPAPSPTLYLLDEPTTGLHFADIEKLLTALFLLRDAGHTLIAAEHDPDFLRHADWLIELGPEGGPNGGHCCVQMPGRDQTIDETTTKQ